MELSYVIILFLAFVGTGLALECYVCQDQPDNKDKCTKTSVQCREEEDTCLTHIEWRAPDFWTPRSEKIFYLHKSCNMSNYCAQQQAKIGLNCMRDWYRDWECMECCLGDRCNFYVTLGAGSQLPNLLVIAASSAVAWLAWRR